MTDEQKSFVIEVKMKSPGEKWYMLECDKKLRQCTQDCRVLALKNGIGRGDEVLFTINGKDQFSHLTATGNKFKLDELPKPAGAIIDADAELLKLQNRAKEMGLDACSDAAGQARDILKQQQQNRIKEEHIASGQIVPGEPLKPTGDSIRIFHEVHRSEIIMWEALLNTAVDILKISYSPEESPDTITCVTGIAEKLHEFIMEKVGEGK